MRATTIRKLIELVQESGIDALEVRSWWRSVRITRKHPTASTNGSSPHSADDSYSQQTITVSAPPAQPRPQAAPAAQAPTPTPAPVAEPAGNLVEIKSPMVGTFYSSPSPDSPAFVKVGDSVSVGTVVCIVEAMKLMNEIESESKGKISKIMVENGQPVEFGQVLFLIDPSA